MAWCLYCSMYTHIDRVASPPEDVFCLFRYATVGAVVDPVTNEKQEKAVFVVFFAGERARTKILKVSSHRLLLICLLAAVSCGNQVCLLSDYPVARVVPASLPSVPGKAGLLIRRCPCMFMQICEAYGANRYPFPEDQSRRREMEHEVYLRLQELHTTIDAGKLRCRIHTWVAAHRAMNICKSVACTMQQNSKFLGEVMHAAGSAGCCAVLIILPSLIQANGSGTACCRTLR